MNQPVVVRRAVSVDVPAVQRLAVALSLDATSAADTFGQARDSSFFEAALDQPEALLLVAESAGQIVGYLRGGISPFAAWRPIVRAELMSFYVSPDYRNQGVGQRLSQNFLAWARQQGAVRAVVSAYASNIGAINFYKKLGFKPYMTTLEMPLDTTTQ